MDLTVINTLWTIRDVSIFINNRHRPTWYSC